MRTIFKANTSNYERMIGFSAFGPLDCKSSFLAQKDLRQFALQYTEKCTLNHWHQLPTSNTFIQGKDFLTLTPILSIPEGEPMKVKAHLHSLSYLKENTHNGVSKKKFFKKERTRFWPQRTSLVDMTMGWHVNGKWTISRRGWVWSLLSSCQEGWYTGGTSRTPNLLSGMKQHAEQFHISPNGTV